MTSKRNIEKRIEEQETGIETVPDEEKDEFQQLMDEIDRGYSEDAGLEALAEVVHCMFADQHDDWSDVPSPLAEDSAFETVAVRDRHATALAKAMFSSDSGEGAESP